MIAYIKNKIAEKTGFSLTELLTTTLILSLVTATIASSIPGAIRAYRTVVDVANANILLTSTITKLRSELTGASKIDKKNWMTPMVKYWITQMVKAYCAE